MKSADTAHVTSASAASELGGNLVNDDLAPVPQSKRTWSMWNIAALWIGMAICIPTYNMASGLIGKGMDWKQAIFTIFLGNALVLIPMALNAHAGTAYGIPFPVLLRSSFGIYGSNIPALMRGLVACGWFGIQTWIGGSAIYQISAVLLGFSPEGRTLLPVLGISFGELLSFLAFWAINMAIILKGIDCIKWLENWSAPFLLLVGLALLVWAYQAADGWGPLLNQESKLAPGEFWGVFIPSLTAMVGFWATLSLNIPDFSRFARSQKDQLLGQAIGLPGTMALYAFIGVVVTSATVVVFGGPIWDPVLLLAKFSHPVVVILGLLALAVATLSTNLAANVVSPANDFSNLAPRLISFKTGGVITGIIGILICPWELMKNADRYFGWLVAYSALLGPIGGVMIADYFLIRRRQLKVEDLYRMEGEYRFCGGFNPVALLVLLLSILPNIPGFLVAIHLVQKESVPSFFLELYQFAFFAGFGIALFLHFGISAWMKSQRLAMPDSAA